MTFCLSGGTVGSYVDSVVAPATRAKSEGKIQNENDRHHKIQKARQGRECDEIVHTSQHLQLFFEFANELRVGILVHNRLVLNLLGLIGISQRTQSLLIISRRDGSNHRCLRIPPETVLQEPGKDLQRKREGTSEVDSGHGSLIQSFSFVHLGTERKGMNLKVATITHRVTIRDEFICFALLTLLSFALTSHSKCRDNLSERSKRFIDVRTLLKALACSAS